MDTPNKIEDIIKKINARYPYSTDRRNYGDMLSGVGNRAEVEDIVGDISTIVFGISREPYYMSEYKDVLYAYMNTCILNNYEFNEDSTLDLLPTPDRISPELHRAVLYGYLALILLMMISI